MTTELPTQCSRDDALHGLHHHSAKLWAGRPCLPSTLGSATRLVKRTVQLHGKKTSIALEPLFWDALDAYARIKGIPWGEVVALAIPVDELRRASRLRLACLLFARALGEAQGKRRIPDGASSFPETPRG